jgi:uncharacterized protein
MDSSTGMEVRNLRFEVGPRVPRHWHGGRKAVTLFFNNLSVFFPAGEKFFIEAVRAHQGLVSDERLHAEMKVFFAQEGIHRREHIRYNAMLREQGYPVDAMEARVQRILDVVTRLFAPQIRLAVTASLEHFTALLADMVLRNPRLLEGADPVMAELWRWHSAEENEHKAVAFDLYQAAGGTYPERCWVMFVATVIFWAKVIEHQARLMHEDGILFSAEEWGSLLEFLFVRPGRMLELLPHYLDYYRPGFHPWDFDNRALLDQWKAERAVAAE